jgi:antitoxin component YwqK of YwqJK toxin-antitoxin module
MIFHLLFGSYKNDIRNIRAQMIYVDGKMSHHIDAYYENGKLKIRGSNVDGILQNWYENGNIHHITTRVNGIKHGICEEWYACGTIKEQVMYVNGKMEGNICWGENGNILIAETYPI